MDEDYFDGNVFIHYHLESRGFKERLKSAWNHIRGKKSKYGDYGELILEPSKTNINALKRIVKSLEDAKKEISKRERKRKK
jgi:hypothetical protein